MTDSRYVKTIIIQFQQEIHFSQLPFFRGGIIATMNDADLLFHNHTDNNKLRYAYPLIQYKRIGGKAAMVCLGEGTDAIGNLFANSNFDIKLGKEDFHLEVEKIRADRILVQVWDTPFEYNLRKWLPLNQENHQKYIQFESLVDKYAMLENLLTANILSFAKGLNITIDKDIVVKIKSVENEQLYLHKGVKMMGFDVLFSTNVSLPNYIGIGKGVSMGFGMIKAVKKIEQKSE